MELNKFHFINLQSLGLLALFLSGIAVAIFGMKFNWIMSDTFVKWYTGFTVIVHLLQLLVPVIVRLVREYTFSSVFHAYNAYD
jgi:hypothetical protein